jgi:hypothetical protein
MGRTGGAVGQVRSDDPDGAGIPELQGIMGRYYALHDQEASEVAQALEEQYLPRFAGDRLPATATGRHWRWPTGWIP